jgi:transcriptional regulator with XRE-family HTH domain
MTTESARGSTLRAVRRARGISLRQAATRAHIDVGHLSKVERGQKQLSIDSLYRLAVVLDLRELARLIEPYTSEDAVS